jgi:acetoin utilization deacetylase AcuC-like enzyme
MPLTIVTNSSCFHGDRGAGSHPAHLGTPDRDNGAVMFDSPAKARKALEVAESVAAGCKTIEIVYSERTPSFEALKLGHSAEYIHSLRQASENASHHAGQAPIIPFGSEAAASSGTFVAATRAVGASFTALDTVLKSPHSTSFALVWPPGHHAERDQAMGFCYLSNAGLAALYAANHSQRVDPTRPNRVAVIDIDHHRANGTASVLSGHERTLLVDLCYRSPYDMASGRYLDDAREYPYTKHDATRGIGGHPATEAPNVLPIEFEGVQRPERIIERFIAEGLPRLREFKPDVIIWSVGLDSLQGDPLGGLGNLPGSFYTLIRGLRCAFPGARHAGVLEGGYDLPSFRDSLPPALLAFNEDAASGASRSSLFKRYRSAFESVGEV